MTTTVRITNGEGGSHDVLVTDDQGEVATLKPGEARVLTVWQGHCLTISEVAHAVVEDAAPEAPAKPAARERRRNVEKDA